MISIRAKVNSGRAQAMIAKAQEALRPEAIDPVIERVALRTHREVVEATPKRWFGQVRRSWQIEKPAIGARLVRNDNKIMLFLEEGTAEKGTGYIYPKRKKMLYIPRTRKAAVGGWHPGLRYGRDYILRRRVRGIRPRYIAAKQQKKSQGYLHEAMKAHLRRAIA
jgi:hypothetical protein